MTRTLFAAAAAFAVLSAPAAYAAVTVFGDTAAHECYQAAIEGRTDRGSLRHCETALQQESITNRDRAATLVNRGVIRLHRAEYETALSDFDSAIRLMPSLGESHVDRGAALIMLRDYAPAIVSITRGIELGTEDLHEAYFNRALAHEFSGNLRGAYEDYRRASELAPEWPRPHLELARFQVRQAE